VTDDVLGSQSSEGSPVFLIGTLRIPTMLEEALNIIVPAVGKLGNFCGDELNVVAMGWFVLLLN